MNRVLLLFALLLTPPAASAHGGEDHGAGGARATAGASAVTASALSRRFEVVLKHAPVRGGQPYQGTLYLADFATNAPVAGATVTLEEPGVSGRPFTVRAAGEPGVYLVERPSGFARDGDFNLAVRIRAGDASDLVLLQHVYVGPIRTPALSSMTAAPADESQEGLPWLWILVVLVLGVAFAAWLALMARKRRALEPAASTPAVPTAAGPGPVATPTRP